MPSSPRHREALIQIERALEELRFGTITITVHDAKLVQLEISEKRRFNP